MFEVTFLGTAASMPAAERGLPGLLVACGAERLLIDCGEGTQRQLLRSDAGFRRLNRVLLTHAHLDHILGLAGLIATLGLLKTGGELLIGGSTQTLAFAERYLLSLWPEGRTPVPVGFVPLEPGALVDGPEFRLRAFAVAHRGTQSLGFRLETPPRRHLQGDRLHALGVPSGPERAALVRGESVTLADGRIVTPDEVLGPPLPGASLAIVGDAEETTRLAEPARGADALIIEATFLDRDAALARERGHLTAGDAARLAAVAGVGALHLTHLSGRYDPAEVAIEARRFFPEAHVAADFDRIRVPAATSGGAPQRPLNRRGRPSSAAG
jgi:ribonuclease Z